MDTPLAKNEIEIENLHIEQKWGVPKNIDDKHATMSSTIHNISRNQLQKEEHQQLQYPRVPLN